MPSIHPYAPRGIPSDVADLMARFGLNVRELLTTDRQSAKLRHGVAIARAVILYHMPARALAAAITPDNDANGAACRSFIPSLLELAEREQLTARALAWNGCPWATAGCGGDGGGCLNFSGHGGMAGNGNAVQAARGRRTLCMISNPETYGRAVFWAVLRHLRAARRDGLPLSVRLRGTDEGPAIGWHRLRVTLSSAESRSIADRYGVDAIPGALTMAERLASVPDLHGYEYSKAPLDGPLGLLAQRQHCDITASFKADSAMACHDGLAALQNGFRLAVPVAVKRGDPLPVGLTLSHGGQSVTVSTVDGDLHDHRWMDGQGSDAVAVMLRTKKSAGSVASVADLFSLQPHDRPQRLADGTVRLAWAD
jgi:hypothetical protein